VETSPLSPEREQMEGFVAPRSDLIPLVAQGEWQLAPTRPPRVFCWPTSQRRAGVL